MYFVMAYLLPATLSEAQTRTQMRLQHVIIITQINANVGHLSQDII